MKTIQKLGGWSALYLAAAYLVSIVLFLFVLDYPSIVDPAQKVALLINKQNVIYLTNLTAYVFFGIVLVLLMLALHERMNAASPMLMKVASILGFIWAGTLIASGLVANAGIAPVVSLYQTDPSQAAVLWSTFETISTGLGGANSEILGGLMTLLVSIAGLKTSRLPKALNVVGIVVGCVGIASTVPALVALTGAFGVSQVIWFVWLGIVLLQKSN